MVTSENQKIDKAVVAQLDEIEKLSLFLNPYQYPRRFSKSSDGVLLHAPASRALEVSTHTGRAQKKLLPYQHLSDELTLLLGICGSQLVQGTWEHYGLALTDDDPSKLRPALHKIFFTAARIAAPRGNSGPLKAIVRGFEACFFTISGATDANPSDPEHRFALLAMIQAGNGANLLTTVLACESAGRPSGTVSLPSQQADQDALRLRREFLMESAYRSKNWTEAYRQTRLLGHSSPTASLSGALLNRRREIYQRSLNQECHPSKKKQILSDLGKSQGDQRDVAREYVLRAASTPAVSCRPGEQDAALCQVLPSSDPRWRIALRQLYRHRPAPEDWMSSLRKLWQQEATSRPYYRLLFALVRTSRGHADMTSRSLPPLATAEPLEPSQIRARLDRVRGEVAIWDSLFGPSETETVATGPTTGSVIRVRHSLWAHTLQVATELGLPAPKQIRVSPGFADVRVQTRASQHELVVSPTLLSSKEGEARFLIARALFRHAGGLDRIAPIGRHLMQGDALARRAMDYAEWMGHHQEPLAELRASLRDNSASLVDLQVSLEELFWLTDDPIYSKLCEVVANRGWCPGGELEADIFAHRYCPMIDATYGVIASEFSSLEPYLQCEGEGLGSLIPQLKKQPSLALRIQNLWMSGGEEVQKGRRITTRNSWQSHGNGVRPGHEKP